MSLSSGKRQPLMKMTPNIQIYNLRKFNIKLSDYTEVSSVEDKNKILTTSNIQHRR